MTRPVLFLVLSSCALIDNAVDRGVSHCDLREAFAPRPYCQEWRGMIMTPGSDVTPSGVCATLSTTYVKTECPDLDAVVGGCYLGKLGDGSASYHWYYTSEDEPLTAAEVEEKCDEEPFVEWFPFDEGGGDFGPP
jgi:hypothetical protein